MKYKPPSTDVKVVLTLINAKNFAKEFTLKEGASWSLCGAGYYGLCKDLYGSFTYAVLHDRIYTNRPPYQPPHPTPPHRPAPSVTQPVARPDADLALAAS